MFLVNFESQIDKGLVIQIRDEKSWTKAVKAFSRPMSWTVSSKEIL